MLNCTRCSLRRKHRSPNENIRFYPSPEAQDLNRFKRSHKPHKMAPIQEMEEIEIPILYINHLIANKRNSKLFYGQPDVIEPGKIKKLKGEMNRSSNPL